MSSGLKENIEYLGLSYRKEFIKLGIINSLIVGLSLVAYLFMKSIFIIVMGIVILITLNYMTLSSYSSRKRNILKEHSEEFVYIISYFRIFIANKNNVYQSFYKLMDYSSSWMKERLEAFLKMIDDDKSIKPFTDFADKFDLPVARNVLVYIYQMVEQGETPEQLNQFIILFEQMSQNLIEEKKARKERSFDMLNFFPVIGAGIIIASLVFSMLSVVGDMLNVI